MLRRKRRAGPLQPERRHDQRHSQQRRQGQEQSLEAGQKIYEEILSGMVQEVSGCQPQPSVPDRISAHALVSGNEEQCHVRSGRTSEDECFPGSEGDLQWQMRHSDLVESDSG